MTSDRVVLTKSVGKQSEAPAQAATLSLERFSLK